MAFRMSPSLHSTEFSPFYLLFGEEMRLPFDAALESLDALSADAKMFLKEFLERLKISREIANLKKTRRNIKIKIKNVMMQR